jgi:small subunit ribosomal protein S13
MVYLLNTEINDRKSIKIGLGSIFGVGEHRALKVCRSIGISGQTSMKSLSIELKNKIILYIENHFKIGDELRQRLSKIKEAQIRLKCYKGQRARHNLPRRGQRTHTNAKTVKKKA